MDIFTPLDNPAWASLTSLHAGFALGSEVAKRYRPEILPFAAIRSAEASSLKELDPFIGEGESFYLIGDLPELPQGWRLVRELPCAQMVLVEAGSFLPAQPGLVSPLDETDSNELFDLIQLVQPGYYLPGTHLLGNYFGIRQKGKLVAVAGERMRLTGFSELSAICTHLNYTGRGYAQQLITHLCQTHIKNGLRSFLHVALTNHRAISLYVHMGFEQRRSINFSLVRKG